MNYEEEAEMVPVSEEAEATINRFVFERAHVILAALAEATNDSEAFIHLPSAAASAFHLGRFREAKLFADRALLLAPHYQNDWNYGNAIHVGHTVLGLLAIEAGDLQTANDALLESGRTPGSPQLNNFGPTMQLAKALLREGYRDTVLTYIGQCRRFWKMGDKWLNLWEHRINEGHVPKFFQHTHV